MKKILTLLFAVGICITPPGSDADAFQGRTHRNMTNQAITYMIQKEGFAPSCPTYPMIAEGTVVEDIPEAKSFFHFSPKLSSWYASADCDATAWAFESKPCTAKIPLLRETLSNDFNWPNAVAGAGTDAGWVALGHLLHLLQDMAVPAHTRNDPHPSFEPLEKEAEKLFPSMPNDPLLAVLAPQDLFRQLRDHTRSRHFSSGTCFHPALPGPRAVGEDNDYFYDADKRRIAHKTMTYEWTKNKRDCSIDTIIAQEQSRELGPLAIRYAASLIKYYSNQTDTTPCPSSPTWVKTFIGPYRNIGHSVQQTDDRGYIIAGAAMSSPGWEPDALLIKTDAHGEMEWEKRYGGNYVEYGHSVQQTTDRGYIVAGLTTSFHAEGNPEVYLMKTDADGSLLWQRAYGKGDGAFAYSVQQTTDGGYILAGRAWVYSAPSLPGWDHAYLIKTDPIGSVSWEKIYASASTAWSLLQTSDGGYISAGRSEGSVYLMKVDKKGALQWGRTYENCVANDNNPLQPASDGGYVLLTEIYSTEQRYNLHLIRTDAEGMILWEKTYSDPENKNGYSMQQTRDGGYIITGATSSPLEGTCRIYLLKIDPEGNMIWSHSHAVGDQSWGTAVRQTQDGGYVVTGNTYSYKTQSHGIFLMKTDQNGNL